MKYYNFEAWFDRYPCSCNNMRKALHRIGEINPFEIKRLSLSNGRKCPKNLSERKYVKRGVLNIRSALNGNLGKSGKFSNRMITCLLSVKQRGKDGDFYLKTTIPKKEFAKIAATIFCVLWNQDSMYCERLLLDEQKDIYSQKILNNCRALCAIVPIQTNIIVRSAPAVQEARDLRENIARITRL